MKMLHHTRIYLEEVIGIKSRVHHLEKFSKRIEISYPSLPGFRPHSLEKRNVSNFGPLAVTFTCVEPSAASTTSILVGTSAAILSKRHHDNGPVNSKKNFFQYRKSITLYVFLMIPHQNMGLHKIFTI